MAKDSNFMLFPGQRKHQNFDSEAFKLNSESGGWIDLINIWMDGTTR
jgi:hypothetical protein